MKYEQFDPDHSDKRLLQDNEGTDGAPTPDAPPPARKGALEVLAQKVEDMTRGRGNVTIDTIFIDEDTDRRIRLGV